MKRQKILDILACPRCSGDVLVEKDRGRITCKKCWTGYRFEGDVPIMIPDPTWEIRRDEAPAANVYSPWANKIIERHDGGLVLDDGAGNNKDVFPHLVQLEMYLSPTTDVVGDALNLPFREASFDAVISEAVVEHVRDPFRYVAEIHRVLKEGGEVRIDAPFLHPYHAVPHHYFNMTRSGLELLMGAFEKVQCGVGPHQEPWVALRDILKLYETAMIYESQRSQFLGMSVSDLMKTLREEKDLVTLRSLHPGLLEYIAAGVYFEGMKRREVKPPAPKEPTVTVIVACRDDEAGVEECLQSIVGQRYPKERMDVVLVDVESKDGETFRAKERYPRSKVVRSRPGIGISASRMQGAREATGEYVAFIDSGCRVGEDWLEKMLAPLDPSRKIICSASRLLDPAGGVVALPGGMDFLGRPTTPENSEEDAPSGPALFPLAAGMLIHRETFLRAGGFDRDYFGVLDDLDLGWRLWVLGYEVHHAPDGPVRIEAAGDGLDPARQVLLEERGALTSLYKNYDEGNLRRILPVAILLALQRGWSHSRILPARYRFDSSDEEVEAEKISKVHAAHILAVDEFLRNLERLHGRRMAIQGKRARSDEEIAALFGSSSIPAEEDEEYRRAYDGLVESFDLAGLAGAASERSP